MSSQSSLSSYMRRAINSRFPQYELLSSNCFLKLLKNFDIKFNGRNFDLKLLEYYDRNVIIRPIMRINRPLINAPNQRYDTIVLDNCLIRDQYLERGLVQFPEEEEFQDWSIHKDGSDKRTLLYYHPAQFMAFQVLTVGNSVVLPFDIESIEDSTRWVKEWKERLAREIEVSRNAYRTTWTKRIGLLILLEEAYSPFVRGFTIRSARNNGSLFKQWKKWRLKEFSAQDLLDASGMNIKEVRDFYELLAFILGFSNDPLRSWFVFEPYIKNSKIDKLELQSSRAQEYYKFARMVNRFIYDLTNESMPEPDEVSNPNWKENYYNVEKFTYSKIGHRRKVLNDFLEQQLPQMRIAVEGDTEEIVVNAILKARNVEQEREGLLIFNAKGSNMERKLEGYLQAAKEQRINVFVIVDRDKKDFIDNCITNRILKRKWVHVWRDDFEHDNFGMKRVIGIVNDALSKQNLPPIKEKHVRARMIEAKKKNEKSSFMHELDLENRHKNKCKLALIISKKEIAQSLIKERIKEIKIGYETGGWETDMRIEKVIKRILTELMPPRSY